MLINSAAESNFKRNKIIRFSLTLTYSIQRALHRHIHHLFTDNLIHSNRKELRELRRKSRYFHNGPFDSLLEFICATKSIVDCRVWLKIALFDSRHFERKIRF